METGNMGASVGSVAPGGFTAPSSGLPPREGRSRRHFRRSPRAVRNRQFSFSTSSLLLEPGCTRKCSHSTLMSSATRLRPNTQTGTTTLSRVRNPNQAPVEISSIGREMRPETDACQRWSHPSKERQRTQDPARPSSEGDRRALHDQVDRKDRSAETQAAQDGDLPPPPPGQPPQHGGEGKGGRQPNRLRYGLDQGHQPFPLPRETSTTTRPGGRPTRRREAVHPVSTGHRPGRHTGKRPGPSRATPAPRPAEPRPRSRCTSRSRRCRSLRKAARGAGSCPLARPPAVPPDASRAWPGVENRRARRPRPARMTKGSSSG